MLNDLEKQFIKKQEKEVNRLSCETQVLMALLTIEGLKKAYHDYHETLLNTEQVFNLLRDAELTHLKGEW